MGYESLSTVVVLVIVAIIIVVWLPVRTANGMKRVDEHRQDRYSPSLHIVDAENGRRFGDIKPHKAKGAAMPASTPSARLTSEHIAHVRELRRAAIRRRQILAVCLLAITVLVFAVSFPCISVRCLLLFRSCCCCWCWCWEPMPHARPGNGAQGGPLRAGS